MIQQELHILFPDKNIPKPTFIKTHLWEVGLIIGKKIKIQP